MNGPKALLIAGLGTALACALATAAQRASPTRARHAGAPWPVGLSIAAPASAALADAAPGEVVTGHPGPVRIDGSGAAVSWTATVSLTDLSTGAGTPGETIAADRVSYWSGPAIAGVGAGDATPGQATAAQAENLGIPRTAFGLRSGGLVTSVVWNPTLVVSVPATGVVAGPYTATVRYSVA